VASFASLYILWSMLHASQWEVGPTMFLSPFLPPNMFLPKRIFFIDQKHNNKRAPLMPCFATIHFHVHRRRASPLSTSPFNGAVLHLYPLPRLSARCFSSIRSPFVLRPIPFRLNATITSMLPNRSFPPPRDGASRWAHLVLRASTHCYRHRALQYVVSRQQSCYQPWPP
jgi:hypothetical protein